MVCRTYNALPFGMRYLAIPFCCIAFPLAFPLLDESQPRKTNGEGHHHDQDGILDHLSCPKLLISPERSSECPRTPIQRTSETSNQSSKTLSLSSHSGCTSADGSAGLADGGSCYALTLTRVLPAPQAAATSVIRLSGRGIGVGVTAGNR